MSKRRASPVGRNVEGYPAMALLLVLSAGALILPLSLGSAVTGVTVASVDIGNGTSETECTLDDWGDPVECTGTGWGGLVGDCRVVWQPALEPVDDERSATITIPIPEEYAGSVHYIHMSVLDGQADDSFEVFVTDPRDGSVESVWTYEADPSTAEFWVLHVIPLPVVDGACPVPHGVSAFAESGYTITITATGDPSTWTLFYEFGMLAVDYITLVGDGKNI